MPTASSPGSRSTAPSNPSPPTGRFCRRRAAFTSTSATFSVCFPRYLGPKRCSASSASPARAADSAFQFFLRQFEVPLVARAMGFGELSYREEPAIERGRFFVFLRVIGGDGELVEDAPLVNGRVNEQDVGRHRDGKRRSGEELGERPLVRSAMMRGELHERFGT